MNDKTKGLYKKFDVRRADGSSEAGGKHHGCEYFVLDLDHDPHAVAAIHAYADSCESEYAALAADLRARVGPNTQVQPSRADTNVEGIAMELETVNKLERDASRYRWLRDRMAVEDVPEEHPPWSTPSEHESAAFDQAVDARMKAT